MFLCRSNYSVTAALLSVALAISAADVNAALGQAPSWPASAASAAAASNTKKLNSTLSASAAVYEVVEVQLENGITLKEYTRPDGVVFAVTWRGPVLPDLSALLGTYFQTFKQATDQIRLTGKRGGPVNISTDGLFVHSGGRMRHFVGHAYAPALVPTGMVIQDVLP
jgi:hypothetical protein